MTGFLSPGQGSSPSGQFLAWFFGQAAPGGCGGPADVVRLRTDQARGRYLLWAAPAIAQALTRAVVDPAKAAERSGRDRAAYEETEAGRILCEQGRTLDSLRQDDTPASTLPDTPTPAADLTARDDDEKQTIEVLSRRTRNTPVLTGEAGGDGLRFNPSTAA